MRVTPAGGCLPPLQADACHPFRIYNRQRGPREMKIELPTRRSFGHLILILSSTMKTASATAATVMGAVASVSVMLVVRPVRPQPSSGSSSSGSISSKHHCKNVVDGLTTTTATMATATTKAPAPAPALDLYSSIVRLPDLDNGDTHGFGLSDRVGRMTSRYLAPSPP